MSEQWRGIPGFEGRYQVSEHGDPGISRHMVKRERSVRGKLRSATHQGIADAMAEQWGRMNEGAA